MQFPASAVTSLIEGYCADFVALAAVFAQTLEQVSMRNLNFDASRPSLQRIEHGMRELADAIQELLERHDRGEAKACPTTATAPPVAALASTAGTRSIPKSAIPPKSTPAAPAHTSQKPGEPKAGETRATEARPAPRSADTRTGDSRVTDTRIGDSKLADLWADGKPNPATKQPGAATPPAGTITGTASASGAMQPPVAPPAPPTAAQTAAAPSNRARPAASTAPRPPAAQSRFGARREGQKPEGLRGNSQSMPLLSVFQFLGRMRKMGTMKVQVEDEVMTFELDSGCVLFTTSDNCPVQERLGELLIEQDACTRDQVEELISKVDEGAGELFGQLAVKLGVVTQPQVVKALEEQVRRRFTRACKTPESTYEFLEGVRSSAEGMFRIQPVAVG